MKANHNLVQSIYDFQIGCFQYDKDSKMKANHNLPLPSPCLPVGCFQYDKDSKMKANHNIATDILMHIQVVSSTTKIVKWKQITTEGGWRLK